MTHLEPILHRLALALCAFLVSHTGNQFNDDDTDRKRYLFISLVQPQLLQISANLGMIY